jgi:DNA-binding transcriptional regulator PaaX
LTDDPQLPFELLPHNWQGEKAYNLLKAFSLKESGRHLIKKKRNLKVDLV